MTSIPGVTNINQKYQWIEGYFANKFRVPRDTFATADSGYIGYKNGFFQFKLPENWATMPHLILTNPQLSDAIVLGDTLGHTLINYGGQPGSETAFSGVPTIIDLGNLSYFVNTNGPYKINGVPYPTSSGTVTLPVGSAGVDSGRVDQIVATAAGVGSIQGNNSDNPVAKEVDRATTLEIGTVLILEDQTVPATLSTNTIVYDENIEFTITNTATINPNSATNPFHGSKTISITGFTAGQNITFTHSVLNKSDYTNIIGAIRINNAWNAATQYSIQLVNGAVITNSVPLTTWGIVKTITGSYQQFSIPINLFTGSPQFTAIRIIRTGTGGTTNWLLDYVQLQNSSVTVTPPTSSLLFARTDFLTNQDMYFNFRNHIFTQDSINRYQLNLSGTNDSAFLLRQYNGTPLFRVNTNNSTTYISGFLDVSNSALVVTPSGPVISSEHSLYFNNHVSDIVAFQSGLTIQRSYPILDGMFGLQIDNDTLLLQHQDTTAYHPISIKFTSPTDNISREIFWTQGDGGVGIVGIKSFADNAAALSGGLVIGNLYRTGDALKIVH